MLYNKFQYQVILSKNQTKFRQPPCQTEFSFPHQLEFKNLSCMFQIQILRLKKFNSGNSNSMHANLLYRVPI